jgi:hypothetical protein
MCFLNEIFTYLELIIKIVNKKLIWDGWADVYLVKVELK